MTHGRQWSFPLVLQALFVLLGGAIATRLGDDLESDGALDALLAVTDNSTSRSQQQKKQEEFEEDYEDEPETISRWALFEEGDEDKGGADYSSNGNDGAPYATYDGRRRRTRRRCRRRRRRRRRRHDKWEHSSLVEHAMKLVDSDYIEDNAVIEDMKTNKRR
eukprot:TRINITY_DN77586_c0_g1_i1.p1 TRINITY_DN77586_c0_g1~~TRINITY_DN77586_c0_g1_i1.p1  ORF type:complete len:162 (+),score=38.56 TRINITY_DN77586_c0_g1_i1:98-583(+)